MKVSKIKEILKEKSKLLKVANECNFFEISKKDSSKAYGVLFDKLGLSTCFKDKKEKRNAELKFRKFFIKNTEVSFNSLYICSKTIVLLINPFINFLLDC